MKRSEQELRKPQLSSSWREIEEIEDIENLFVYVCFSMFLLMLWLLLGNVFSLSHVSAAAAGPSSPVVGQVLRGVGDEQNFVFRKLEEPLSGHPSDP